jgi:hypothetical protein
VAAPVVGCILNTLPFLVVIHNESPGPYFNSQGGSVVDKRVDVSTVVVPKLTNTVWPFKRGDTMASMIKKSKILFINEILNGIKL